MTTNVTVDAHCYAPALAVRIEVGNTVDGVDVKESVHTIQDGELFTVHVYDNRYVKISEVPKDGAA